MYSVHYYTKYTCRHGTLICCWLLAWHLIISFLHTGYLVNIMCHTLNWAFVFISSKNMGSYDMVQRYSNILCHCWTYVDFPLFLLPKQHGRTTAHTFVCIWYCHLFRDYRFDLNAIPYYWRGLITLRILFLQGVPEPAGIGTKRQ